MRGFINLLIYERLGNGGAFGQRGAALKRSTCVALEFWHPPRRLEASTISWRIHVRKPSTNVLTPPKLGALREVARDNILLFTTLYTQTNNQSHNLGLNFN